MSVPGQFPVARVPGAGRLVPSWRSAVTATSRSNFILSCIDDPKADSSDQFWQLVGLTESTLQPLAGIPLLRIGGLRGRSYGAGLASDLCWRNRTSGVACDTGTIYAYRTIVSIFWKLENPTR